MFEKPTDSLPETQPLDHLAVEGSSAQNLQHSSGVLISALKDSNVATREASTAGSDGAGARSSITLGQQNRSSLLDRDSRPDNSNSTEPESSPGTSPELYLGDYFDDISEPAQHLPAMEMRPSQPPILVPVLGALSDDGGRLAAKQRQTQRDEGIQEAPDDDLSTFGEYFEVASPEL